MGADIEYLQEENELFRSKGKGIRSSVNGYYLFTVSICLSFLYVLVNFFEKCSECVHVKKSCSFSSQFFFCVKISHLLHAYEKLKQNQIIMKKNQLKYII